MAEAAGGPAGPSPRLQRCDERELRNAQRSGGLGSQKFTAPDNVGQLQRLRDITSQTSVDRVLVTIGGNDLGFSGIIKRCRGLLGGGACLKRIDQLEIPHLRNNVQVVVKQGLESIRGVVGKGAEIVLVGYPDVIPERGKPFHDCDWLDHGEKDPVCTA